MLNQRNDFRLFKQHYKDIGEHKVTRNYNNFDEKIPVLIPLLLRM